MFVGNMITYIYVRNIATLVYGLTNLLAELDESSKINQSSMYAFDHIFGSDSKTNEIYGPVCHDIVQSVMAGVNGTIFAYVCDFFFFFFVLI